MKTLGKVSIGTTVKVVKIRGEGAIKRHIMDMGITKGCQIYVRKVAPLGDPIEITVRGYELTLRKSEADNIEVESLRGGDRDGSHNRIGRKPQLREDHALQQAHRIQPARRQLARRHHRQEEREAQRDRRR